MRVVLSGYYGFHNVGDEAILLSIITALRQVKEDIQITVLSNDPAFTEKEYSVAAVDRWNMKEVYRALQQSDGLISGGGSLLQDKTGPKSIPYYLGVMKLAQFAKKPFFIYAQGIGPVQYKWNKWLIKRVFRKAAYISVRDESSKKLLESLHVQKEVQLVPDPVLGLPFQSVEKEQPEKVVTVSVRDWPSETKYKEKIANALDRLVQHGYDIVLLPMHGAHDAKTSAEIVAMMKEKAEVFPHESSIEEKIQVIADSAFLFGMRLHALIFAALTHTPFAALSYDPKIDAFAKQANQRLLGHVDENWTADELTAGLLEQLQDVKRERQILAEAVQPLKERANETARTIIRLLESCR